jgi:hypothetical protein
MYLVQAPQTPKTFCILRNNDENLYHDYENDLHMAIVVFSNPSGAVWMGAASSRRLM